jgi:hypothetical protein
MKSAFLVLCLSFCVMKSFGYKFLRNHNFDTIKFISEFSLIKDLRNMFSVHTFICGCMYVYTLVYLVLYDFMSICCSGFNVQFRILCSSSCNKFRTGYIQTGYMS